MKLFKKFKAQKTEAKNIRELSAADIETVAGGLNPQPLPPCAREVRF